MARKASTFSFSKVVAEKREDIKRARDEVNLLAGTSSMFAPAYALANQIAKKAEEVGFCKYLYASPSVHVRWDNTIACSLYITIEDYVDSLKEGAIPAMCDFALELGLDATDTSDYANANYAERTYIFRGKVGQVEIRAKFCANIKDDASACRKVIVGTKLEEVAQYEIVCS